jgi:molybdopterin-guanine dinucleotide biosynthesis protein A
MGRDKAGIEFRGKPLAVRAAELLVGLFEDVSLVGGTPPPGTPGRVVADPEGPRSALRGLVAALAAAREDRVVVIATDMPLLCEDLLLALTAWPDCEAVVPRDDSGAHALCALYRREPALEAARARLASGELAMGGLLDVLDTNYIEGATLRALSDDGRALANVNRPEDLVGL